MKTILAGISMIAIVYLATAYDVEIRFNEVAAHACDPNDPGCSG